MAVVLCVAGMTAPVPAGAADATWDVLPPLPEARTEVSAVSVGDRLYAIGGFSAGVGTVVTTARVDVFDASAGSWSRGPDLPLPLHHTAVVALGSRIVVTGGYTTVGFLPVPFTWVLDTSAPAPGWEPFVPLPEPRGAHAAATDGTRIWVFGGALGLFAGLHSRALVLDPGAAAWTPIADFPFPRDHLAGAYIDGRVYAAGGRELSLETNTGRLDVYDVATGAWTRGPDMPTPRGGIAAAIAGGRMVVFGGEAPGNVTYHAAEGFDPASGSWMSFPPMPSSRHGLGAATVNGAIHVVSGGPLPGLTFGDAHERLRPTL